MSNKISVLNSNTAMKRLGQYFLLGTLCFGIFQAPKVVDRVVFHYNDFKNKSEIESFLKESKFTKASILINNSELKKAERMLFESELKERKEIEKRQKRLNNLDNLIEEGKHDKAQELYENYLAQGGVFVAEQSSESGTRNVASSKQQEYAKQIREISLEGMLQQTETATGKKKINLINKLLENYPDYEEINKLKQQQAESCVNVANSYFDVNSDIDATHNLLEGFYSWLKTQDKSLVENVDLKDFEIKGKAYVEVQSKEINSDLEVGDKVVLFQKLGELNGEDKDEIYDGGGKEFKIGQKGIVTKSRYDYGGDNSQGRILYVKFENKKDWCVPRELKKLSSEKIPEISLQINEIINYVNSVRGGNK